MATPDKIYTEVIDSFFGGLSDDVRMQAKEVFAAATHFDIFTNPKRLVPFRAMEADETTSFKIENFAYHLDTLYGAGRKSGGTQVKIYQKTIFDSIASSWAAATSGEDSASNGSSIYACIGFHDHIYGGKDQGIWAYEVTGGFTSSAYGGLGDSIVAQGIVTSDDLLIIPGTSKLYVKNGSGSGPTDSWTEEMDLDGITYRDLTEYGQFIALATSSQASEGISRVFLWDKVSADPSHTIEWGAGMLMLLENIEGTLIGVSEYGRSEEGVIKKKIVIREYDGGDEARVIFELESDDSTLSVGRNRTKIVDGNKITFALQIKRGGVTYYQMVSFGRKTKNYPWVFSYERLVDNTTAVTSIEAAIRLGSTVFVAHNGDGSVNRTNDAAVYTTATYISQIVNGSAKAEDAARRVKNLVMAGVMTAPLTTGQAVSLYIRKDGETSWTLVRTYSYNDDASSENSAVPNMGFESGTLSDGTEFGNFKEIQFKAESTGGAEITGFPYAWKFAGASVISP